ncbi:MAG: 16S rRNA processing protein RimM [Chloroflexi bacterium]|jgi:16S rRNA processing protein RimM|nr:MAG: 16S rRNA processing protein RimM [Chloroflexota bacterium]
MPAPSANPGSPSTGEPVYLAVGLLRRPHGVHGDLLLEIYTDFPDRIRPGTQLFVGDDHQPLKITCRRPHNDGLILGFEGISTPEQAGKYRATVAYVPAKNLPALPDGEYYYHQVIGLTVFDESGKELGILTEIIETGANDVYVVKAAVGKEILLPALKEVILAVDLDAKTMQVHLLPGLLDEDEE